ncbi:ABC transporter ATP-binding protein [Infirmifilum lucidum]|uniref:ABC transporter ATP-binding protein n=1 Tax=Infirmifilum lucidum TaxID=2776706 RepID=A0A7L9FHV2_9CREN|nr:ABC transporter ATP-binding protein [Infirmifilum lucidum]QOJ79408.1 ABC transporter ATP-binding protein [Infirmifilum lucidum]
MIRFEDVDFVYPTGVRAIQGVSLSIESGEFVGVIGHSGAGKTTLAKLATSLLKPTRGRVLIDGKDSKSLPASEAARIVSYVFQNPDMMIFSQTVRDEVAFALRNLGFPESEIEKRVQEALRAVDLNKPLDTPPQTLSFGEKHRLAIASVLVMGSRALVLDEPTTGLDYGRSLMLFDTLNALNASGKTIVVITHDLDLLARYASRIIVLEKGRVIRDGSTLDVLGDADFLESHGFMLTHVQQVARRLGVKAITPSKLAEELADRLHGLSSPR